MIINTLSGAGEAGNQELESVKRPSLSQTDFWRESDCEELVVPATGNSFSAICKIKWHKIGAKVFPSVYV